MSNVVVPPPPAESVRPSSSSPSGPEPAAIASEAALGSSSSVMRPLPAPILPVPAAHSIAAAAVVVVTFVLFGESGGLCTKIYYFLKKSIWKNKKKVWGLTVSSSSASAVHSSRSFTPGMGTGHGSPPRHLKKTCDFTFVSNCFLFKFEFVCLVK